MLANRFGFSTGALARGDYHSALGWMRQHQLRSMELSALRYDELEPLSNDIAALPVDAFAYVSFHAPSYFAKEREEKVVSLLESARRRNWNIVVHPDVIYTPRRWRHFGRQLLIENMDRRKSTGRTVDELQLLFGELPEARLCLDVAHARQLDTTLLSLRALVTCFRTKIAEVHISELDSRCRHLPLSWQSITDYRHFASSLQAIPVIIESVLCRSDNRERQQEVKWAYSAMEQPIGHF